MNKNPRLLKQRGAMVMVEASIYFPITIMMVMALLYYGLFKLQQQAMVHEVQRVAFQSARETVYPSYEVFGTEITNVVDFDWDATEPSSAQVSSYYKNYNNSFKKLYREFCGFGSWMSESEVNSNLKRLTDSITLFTVGNMSTEATVKRGIITNRVETRISYGFPTPGALRYFGIGDTMKLTEGACYVTLNPTDFARDVDLAADAISAIAERLGMSDGLNKVVTTAKKLIGYL